LWLRVVVLVGHQVAVEVALVDFAQEQHYQ
jgi:hypothetical protein